MKKIILFFLFLALQHFSLANAKCNLADEAGLYCANDPGQDRPCVVKLNVNNRERCLYWDRPDIQGSDACSRIDRNWQLSGNGLVSIYEQQEGFGLIRLGL